jgi:alkylated DNA repair dioxygenase AlkB
MVLPSLFEKRLKDPKNIIPHGGEAIYHGSILDEHVADQIFEKLLRETKWKKAEWIIYDKHHVTPRKVAWYGPKKRWPDELIYIKEKVESLTGVEYRHVLLNLYETGEIGLGWHSDEESLEEDSSIASVSLGAERVFKFRHNETLETVALVLEHGSLVEMKGVLQNFWKHHLPKAARVLHPRINLTFRK